MDKKIFKARKLILGKTFNRIGSEGKIESDCQKSLKTIRFGPL